MKPFFEQEISELLHDETAYSHDAHVLCDESPRLVNEPTRERLFRDGPRALSDRELLALVLSNGSRRRNVLQFADKLLEVLTDKEIPSASSLADIDGLGTARAAALVAMLELGRRRYSMAGNKISAPSDIFNLIKHYADYPQERFITLSLTGAHEVIATRIVTVGLVNKTLVHPREVFANIITDRAAALVVAHNHPSGSTRPSSEDDSVTENLVRVADMLGIHFLDHVIFTRTGYFSYCSSGGGINAFRAAK